nr:NAD(P)H-dependent oxidoreductase [Nocardia flavorosea]
MWVVGPNRRPDSYPASLKAAIDCHFTQWQRKPVAFVGYSGATGGLTAIEHLRQVFSELDAHTVREYVPFPRYYRLFGDDGQLLLLAPAEPEAAVRHMPDQVHWWAEALVAAPAVAV